MASNLSDPVLDFDAEAPDLPGLPEDLDDETQPHWPRMLRLDEDTESRLTQYLVHELHHCWSERDLLVEDWTQWQRDYWAKPLQAVKNFPFKRAANVVIPMTAIAVEAIYARLLNTLFSVVPFVSVRPRTKEWIEASPKIERWLQAKVEDPDDLDVYHFAQETLMEFIKLGTVVGKSGYERVIKKTVEDLQGGKTQDRWVEVKNGSTLGHVPLANFLMRLHEKGPQTAAWCGEEHEFTWAELKRMALAGRMDKEVVEKLGKLHCQDRQGTESSGAKYTEKMDELTRTEPDWFESFRVQEVWLSFDVDGDGVDEEIVVDFHHTSQSILSIRYNWYDDLHRPYRTAPYIPVEGRWVGIGVGKQNEQFQQLITTLHRQRLDAGTLANMGQLALKKTSGYGPDEPIFPGKLWFLDDPKNDITPFSLSDAHHSAHINNEMMATAISEKRTGANEMILGSPHEGTPATATSDLSRLAEGNKKYDAVLKNARRFYGRLMSDVLANEQQFGTSMRHWLMLGEDGQWVEQILQMPTSLIRQGAIIDLTITDSITNKDVEQQKWMGLFSVLTGYYDKALERAAMVGDPNLFMILADASLKAGNHAMRRLLETFQVIDIENFLIELDPEALRNVGLTPVGQGNGGGPQGPIAAAGVQQLTSALGNGSRASPSNGNGRR